MVIYFPKIPPLKKILQLQDRIGFFIKNTKNNHSSATTLQNSNQGPYRSTSHKNIQKQNN